MVDFERALCWCDLERGFFINRGTRARLSRDALFQVVFLDFGLMSTVEPFVMEAFATGIQACLSEDYETLAKVFADVGFLILDPETQTPLWRPSKGLAYTAAGVLWPGEDGLKRFTAELTEAMRSVEGAQTRFKSSARTA